MFLLYTAILFTAAVYILYYYCTVTLNYWKVRNVPGPPPVPIFGNLKDAVLRKSNTLTIYKELYDTHPNEKVIGFYRMMSPSVLIRDLDIIKSIMVKDFDHFVERGIEFSDDNLGSNLFSTGEKMWRPLRSRLTPIFTTAKLKHMIYLVVEKGDAFIDYVSNLTAKQQEQNLYSLVQKYTMSTISACAFGLDIDLDDDKNMQKLSKIDKLVFSRSFIQDLDGLFPNVLRMFSISMFTKDIEDFFKGLVKNVVQMRNNMPSNRKDFMDLILELRQEEKILAKNSINQDEFIRITDGVMAGQAFIFYVAGYETSASTLMYALYELSLNPDIQEKLIDEVDEVMAKCNGNVTYDTISDLPYMEKVFNETLRKYPIVEPLQRIAKADYKVPGTDVTVEKGQIVNVSVLGIHRDPKNYPDPDRFDPERFSPENVAKRHPCAYMPFGLGPRNCIGMRFAKVQSRVCLLKLLSKFRVRPSQSTPKKITEFCPYRLVLSPKDSVLLNVIPRTDVKLTIEKNSNK